MQKYLLTKSKEYIFIILTATILLLFSSTKSLTQENIFTVDKVKIEGTVDINFSRDKYINKALLQSFEVLMSKILVSSDLVKLKNIRLDKIKKLINSFNIIEEKYRKNKYEVSFKIIYNEKKVKKFLASKNISFSQPKNIKAVFFPTFFIKNEIKSFNENYFYQNWLKIEIKNELINFILPIEDLDDLLKIQEMKNKIEDFNISEVAKKYDNKNYVFVFMYYKNEKINMHIKTNFEGEKMSKNISYVIDDIEDEKKLEPILKDLKVKITDIWKQSNFVNLLLPLSIDVKFKHTNVEDLDKLKKDLYKIKIIDNYRIE